MYEDAEECEVDELFAWGQILRDIAWHIALGMQKNHGWKFEASVRAIAAHFNEAIRETPGDLEGDFTGGASQGEGERP